MSTHPSAELCARHVAQVIGGVLSQLTDWADVVAGAGPTAPADDVDARVRSLVVPALSAPDGLLAGAGFIAAPEYVGGDDVHFAWWLGALDANPLLGATDEPTRLDLATRVYSGYLTDMRALEWYAVPESTGRPHVTGPYVDHLCVCDYVLTVTVPVVAEDRLIGVVGADVLVRTLERELMPQFRAADMPVTLVNAAGRVVVSTDPGLLVGDLVGPPGDPFAGRGFAPCEGLPLGVVAVR